MAGVWPQERVHALEAQADVLQRNAHVAALGRQQAAAALDAARSELRAAAAQAAAYREQLEQRNNEVRWGPLLNLSHDTSAPPW